MKKLITLIHIVFLISILQQNVVADNSFENKKKNKTKSDTTIVAKQTEYQKLLKKGKTITCKSQFITTHQVGNKLYFELPIKYLNREMLLASTPSEVSELGYADIGYKSTGTLHVKFTRIDSVIYLCKINTRRVTNDTNISKALKITNLDPVLYAYTIKAFNGDSSAVVIEVSEPFCSDAKIFNFFKDMASGLIKTTATFNKDAAKLLECKSFDDNLSIKSFLSYNLTTTYQGRTLMEGPYTMKVTRSLLLLPQEKMKPRIVDSRVGVFRTTKLNFASQSDCSEEYAVAKRWRLIPKDTIAYFKGELSEPEKPIVFYMDNNFPQNWKKPIKEGVEKWNLAFEKIGFKNAIICKEFPTIEEDSCFDPDNLKYSCIRYLPSLTANAMGPSWVDPTTGEIMNASVIVWSNISQLINYWRFVQTAQLDPRVRTKKMPDDILAQSLIYVISHEIGHCLGFMHNMGASSAFETDSLRSPTFTQKYGTTPCIMDYARFNYVAQPEDVGVSLTPPELGVYDYFFIKWNYQYLAGGKNEWQEQKIVEAWVDEHAGDPVYRFGDQQVFCRYDPSSIEEDLGNDPIKSSNYGIKNLKYILSHLEEWIDDDPDYEHRLSLYNQILTQYYRYLRNVMYNIGGIYTAHVKEGTKGEKHTPVEKAKQQQSLQWLLNEYKNMSWLDNDSLKKHFPMQVTGSFSVRSSLLSNIKGLFENIILSSYYSPSPYSIDDFSKDLYNAVWSSLLQLQPLDEGNKALQKAMVKLFCQSLGNTTTASYSIAYAPSLADIFAYNLDQSGQMGKYRTFFENYEYENGCGSAATFLQCIDNEQNTFGNPFPYQMKVNISAIDHSAAYLQDMAVRSRDLLKNRLNSVAQKDKIHYQSLLIQLNAALKDKM
ncbi:MAG: zinc-dependent metalloprotease [Bacteroidales bacterium]|jgi:hypothetical protein|nr:zinc-dependent metalloprotease [Bacteroidales bacterium]